MDRLLNYVSLRDKKTLMIFDLDNTVIEPTGHKGGDNWFRASLAREIKNGLDRASALKRVLPEYMRLQSEITVRPVEGEVVRLIRRFERRHVPIIALTNRSVPIIDVTCKLLNSIGVDFSRTRLSARYFIDDHARLTLGDKISLLVYRSGKPHRLSVTFKESTLAPIRQMYPGYEKIDYEMIGGIVIMPLALNHLPLLVAIDPELTKYLELSNQNEGALIITHVLTTSFAAHMRSIGIGAVIKEVNGIAVKTMQELRDAIRKSLITQFLTIKTSRNIFAALPLKSILEDEPRLAASYFYTMSPFVKELIETSKAHTPHKDETQKKA